MTKTNPHDVVTMTPDPIPVATTDDDFTARSLRDYWQLDRTRAEAQRDIHRGDLGLLVEQMRAWADDLHTGRLDAESLIDALLAVATDVEAGLEETR